MGKTLHILSLFALFGFLLPDNPSFSQNVFSSEDDLKKRANKLFYEENFVEAYPLFSQLLSLYPKEPQYNFKFGTCLLFSSKDKEKAIPYLEFAVKRQKSRSSGVDKEVFFYLGKAYHLNYRFADALRYYNIYKNNASSKQLEKYEVSRQIEMCENGRKLLSNITDLSVMEKKEVPAADFFRSYHLSEFNAKLIIKPDDLKTLLDKKKKDESIMYLSPDQNQIYFSSYGEDEKNGKDIFYATRTPSGDLSKPIRLNDVINTKHDEDYPFLHPNGKILYFCSKGHNSMGGYDIFRSEWNENTQSWGKPANMDFAINTPDDDILFISDSEDRTAYFSSARENAQGMITVFKIALDRKPLDLAIIRGTLTKNTSDKIPDAKITVTKIMNDEIVGVFNTNPSDGSYTLNLPNGGKFMFSVESSGFKKSSELVVIPLQQEIKPLKQSITLVNENGQDKLLIKNEFDAQADSADIALAIQYIKEKASLEVNASEEELAAKPEESTSISSNEVKETTSEPRNITPVTNTDIIEMAYQDAKETQKETNELRKNADAAHTLGNNKNELAQQKKHQMEETMKKAEQISNQEEKIKEIDKATQLKKESETLAKEASLALTLSNQMEGQANKKQQQADAELKYAKELETAIITGANEKKMNELLAQKEELVKKSEELIPFPPDMEKMIAAKEKEAKQTQVKYLDLQQDAEDMQKEATRLRTEAEKTKNNSMKQNLNQQAEELEKESEKKTKEAQQMQTRAAQLQTQTDSLKNSASVIKEISLSPSLSSVATTSAETSSGTVASSILSFPYMNRFIKQIEDTEKKEKELEREETKAVIYQQWTDSLDNQIGTLRKILSTTNSEEEKAKLENKINELQSAATDKRQKASDSRQRADFLKMQEALAVASNISPETTAVSTTTASPTATTTATASKSSVSTENLAGTKNINEYYEKKVQKNLSITNAYEKKVKEQEIYQNWSAALYDESQRLKNEGKGSRAENADKESKAKQLIAIQLANEVSEIKAEHPELVASANFTPEETTETNSEVISSTTESTVPAPTSSETPLTSTTVTPTNPVFPETTAVSSETSVKTETETTSVPSVSLLSTTPPETVKNKDEYTHFVALRNESEWIKSTAKRQVSQADELQKLSDEQLKESQRLLDRSRTTADPSEKEKLVEQSQQLEKRAATNQAKSDSARIVARNTEAEGNSRQNEADMYLQSLDKNIYEELTAATGYKPEKEVHAELVSASNEEKNLTSSTETAANPNPSTTSSETSTVPTTTPSPTVTATEKEVSAETSSATSEEKETALNPSATSSTPPPIGEGSGVGFSSSEALKYYDAIFDKLEFAAVSYSLAKPIPVDPPMPEGLLFKVQIGAFRNPIPENLFRGIKPIVAETTPMGFKRYTAGLFQKFTTANQAKEQVRNLGYRDAFVVAFFNGKRITMNEGLAKAKEAGENIATVGSWSAFGGAVGNSEESSSTNVANTTDVKTVSGLFYTVQVGVFSKPVTSTQLYNISPLNTEQTENGLFRYTTGRFNDEAKAMKAKNTIAEKGIADAFVVAYHNGKRIGLSAAKNLIETQGENILTKSTQEYTFTSSTTRQNDSVGLVSPSERGTKGEGIVFKVQLGAFREEVPIATANKLLAIGGVNTYKDEIGMTIYTTGEFSSYEEAKSRKTELVNQGLSDCFIIAFLDGRRIVITAALEMLKNR